jgi:uncharacterized protein
MRAMPEAVLPSPPRDVQEAEARVLAHLAAAEPHGGVVAVSGGVDSHVVLVLAARAWGADRVVAATSRSESLAPEEMAEAAAAVKSAGVEHVVLRGSELDIEAFRRNAPDRCFHCKDHLFENLRALADERGLAHVVDGSNADDVGEHRPGLGAARRRGVLSPLLACGLTKPWVRAVAKANGLSTWDRPSESCLSSRFPYGVEVTAEGLSRVLRAERAVRALGFRTVRVRVHDPVARIEVPLADLPALLAPGVRERAVEGVRAAGFPYVAVDLEGYRSGSLDEPLRGR